MKRPRLSVCTITQNSGARLEEWAARVFEYADELVVMVDDSSTDDTFDVARRVADRVERAEHPPHTELFHDHVIRRARGEWVLWLDDDEQMAPGFPALLPQLLDEPDLTHYWLPYRWLVARNDGRYGWLRQFPWHPNPRLRLVRNVGSILCHRGRLHSPLEVAGAGDVLDREDATIYHLDLLLRDRAAREAKVARYRVPDAPSCEEYYLFEEFSETTLVEPVPADRVHRPRTPRARRRLAGPAAVGDPLDLAANPPVSLASMRRHVARLARDADVFAATYVAHDTPEQVLPDRGATATLWIRNDSDTPWRTAGDHEHGVRLSYHWVHPEHGVVLHGGDLSLLPGTVAPGATVPVTAGLWTPVSPGRFELHWDLCRGVNGWFSEHGVAPLVVPVLVESRAVVPRMRTAPGLPPALPAAADFVNVAPPAAALRRPAARRDVARRHLVKVARAAAPAGLRRLARTAWAGRFERGEQDRRQPVPDLAARNVLPVPPRRVLDTRDGSGVPGAVRGPLRGGREITLDVRGIGLPDHAGGLVLSLCVLEPTGDGFVTVYAGDRLDHGGGFVSAYLTGGAGPTRVPVLTALADGKMSVHVSEGPAAAHLLVDVDAVILSAPTTSSPTPSPQETTQS